MKVGGKISSIKEKWQRLKNTRRYHNLLLFLMFVIVSGVFWLILSLNDNLQQNYEVDVKINNIPDSVTFINDAPKSMQVTIRDRGVTLLRRNFMKNAVLTIDFKKYSKKGIFRMPKTELTSSLHSIFGSSAQIMSTSVDSLRLNYTTSPGKKVRLVIDANLTATIDNVISGDLNVSTDEVIIFSQQHILDTISQVYTEKLVRRDLTDTTTVDVKIKAIPGVKIVPDYVEIEIPVEPLILRRSIVPISVKNVPKNEMVMLYPMNVEVNYYMPKSTYNDLSEEVIVQADYNDIFDTLYRKLPIKIVSTPTSSVNAVLKEDSVGYTIVKNLK